MQDETSKTKVELYVYTLMQIAFDYDSEIFSLDSSPPMIDKLLVCVARVFVWSWSKDRPRNGIFGPKNRTETLDTQATCTLLMQIIFKSATRNALSFKARDSRLASLAGFYWCQSKSISMNSSVLQKQFL